VRFLSVLASYRQHQKFFRFAHLVFNRISILHGEELMRLSSQAGTLYQLPTADEVTEGENRIVHHAILKADVRGSTTVTDELEKKDLNPASYFSLRFFGPINKVFIVGDAVILSFLEYENPPALALRGPCLRHGQDHALCGQRQQQVFPGDGPAAHRIGHWRVLRQLRATLSL